MAASVLGDAEVPRGPDLKSHFFVKNTFLEIRDLDTPSEESGSLRRTASDSDLSRSERRSNDSDHELLFYKRMIKRREDASDSSECTTRPCSTNSRESANTGDGQHRGICPPREIHASPAQPGTGVPLLRAPLDGKPLQSSPEVGSFTAASNMEDAHMHFLINALHFELNEPMGVLESLAEQGVLQKIPRDEQGHVTSVGSINHFSTDGSVEQCNPCVFWYKSRCTKGILCNHCHFVHKGQKSKRLRASKHSRQRMLKESLDNQDFYEVTTHRPTQNKGDNVCDDSTVAPGPLQTQAYTASPDVVPIPGSQDGPRIIPPAASPWQQRNPTRISL